MLFTEEKKKDTEKKIEGPELPGELATETEEEGIAELVIDVRKMLEDYDVVRIILPPNPGERVTTEHGSELVFFQEETVS